MTSTPLDPEAPLTRIAFGSCFAPQLEESRIWEGVGESAPQLLLLLGDNVYQSEEKAEPELLELREAYGLLAADPTFAALRRQVSLLTTWDDHDYGLNNAGAELPVKRESEALFEHVWAVPEDDPRRRRDGVYGSTIVGPEGRRVQLLLLDTRFFRTPETMLGKAQWRWLETQLRRPAEVRILVSSIRVLTESEKGESWHGWPTERERLLRVIGESGARGVVLISGDSHFGAFYRRGQGAPYPLLELTSSSLNFPIPETHRESRNLPDPTRDGDIFFPANYGLITIDWPAGTVDLALHDTEGRRVRSESVRFAPL